MKDNRVKLFKKSKGKTALFLALLMVLNLAPLPENAGEGLIPGFVKALSNIQRIAGNKRWLKGPLHTYSGYQYSGAYKCIKEPAKDNSGCKWC